MDLAGTGLLSLRFRELGGAVLSFALAANHKKRNQGICNPDGSTSGAVSRSRIERTDGCRRYCLAEQAA